jgi:hypothetical protein
VDDILLYHVLQRRFGGTALGVFTAHSILILFVFSVDLFYRIYGKCLFEMNQCLASRYRFSASLKFMTFQMALR